MPELYKNKYKTTSMRLQDWDYGSEAMYFVTICTKNRKWYFGDIMDPVETQSIVSPLDLPPQYQNQKLTTIGEIAYQEWFKTPELRPDMKITLGEFIVMPNHIHGIVQIGRKVDGKDGSITGTGGDVMHHISTDHISTYTKTKKNKFGPQSKNLASIIRGYKSAVTTYARKQNIDFQWQSLYYESIIRTDASLERISNYIRNNPLKWQMDKYNNL
jgi:putative transposase